MDNPVIIVGGFHEIVELCEEAGYRIEGILDNRLQGEYCGYRVLGTDEDAQKLFPVIGHIPLIITPDSPYLRKKLAETYKKIGYVFATLISPQAKISKTAEIGTGSVIQSGAHISSHCKIGDFVKVNVNANVMHDCCIGNYSTIAPNAVLLGRVSLGGEVYVGANATVLPDIDIASGVTVGAGGVVTKKIEERGRIVKGIPAR